MRPFRKCHEELEQSAWRRPWCTTFRTYRDQVVICEEGNTFHVIIGGATPWKLTPMHCDLSDAHWAEKMVTSARPRNAVIPFFAADYALRDGVRIITRGGLNVNEAIIEQGGVINGKRRGLVAKSFTVWSGRRADVVDGRAGRAGKRYASADP